MDKYRTLVQKKPGYLMYRKVNIHVAKYRLSDGSSFCWVSVSHRGSGCVLYDHQPCHLSRMKWPRDTAMQMSEKSPPLQGREVGEVYLHNMDFGQDNLHIHHKR